jgi:hypothetical protein
MVDFYQYQVRVSKYILPRQNKRHSQMSSELLCERKSTRMTVKGIVFKIATRTEEMFNNENSTPVDSTRPNPLDSTPPNSTRLEYEREGGTLLNFFFNNVYYVSVCILSCQLSIYPM